MSPDWHLPHTPQTPQLVVLVARGQDEEHYFSGYFLHSVSVAMKGLATTIKHLTYTSQTSVTPSLNHSSIQ